MNVGGKQPVATMMKTLFPPTLFCLFAAGTVCFAQQQAKPGAHLSMQVDNVASGGKASTGKGSQMGVSNLSRSSPSATVLSSTTVSKSSSQSSAPRNRVQVSNFAAMPEEATVEWYVFAKEAASPGRHAQQATPYVHDKGSEKITVGPRKTVELFFQPKPIVAITNKSSSSMTERSSADRSVSTQLSASSETSGEKFVGWIVRLKVGEDLVAVRASNAALEEMGKSGNGLQSERKPKPRGFLQ